MNRMSVDQGSRMIQIGGLSSPVYAAESPLDTSALGKLGGDAAPLLPMHNSTQDKPSTPSKKQQAQQNYPASTIALVVAFYFASSLGVVFLNKYILSSSEYKFPYPLTVTWYQLVVALGLLVVFGQLTANGVQWSLVPPFEYKLDVAQKIAPLTIIYVLMLAFNNLCLNYVQVTFYQVARSLTILFNIAFSYFVLNTKTSNASLISCGVVFLGFVLGSMGEVEFSWLGVFFGVGSSFFVALYGIYVKKTLAVVDNDQWRLLHYNTMNAIWMMFPLIVFSGELSEAMSETFLTEFSFIFMMTITGVTGFLINIAMFLQIKFTTPLTNTISGTAKACVQTIVAWFIWRNPISGMNAFGIFLTLFGSGLYSFVRYREMQK